MRIAVVNETSAGDKNAGILSALDGRGHEIINVGMKERGATPELTYIHTGLLAAILLNTKRADLVVGGCGTGQGFLNSCMQYPRVICGLILDPSDAWLFRQINGGNCIALALNKGYGWAGEVNLSFIFDRFFSVQSGQGYPAHRQESQQKSIATLESLSLVTHLPFDNIIEQIDEEVLRPVLNFPGVTDFLDVEKLEDESLKSALQSRLRQNMPKRSHTHGATTREARTRL